MNFIKTVLRRPVSVVMIIVAIAVFGISSVVSMPQELTPEMNMSMLVVYGTYSGASPEDVNDLVTKVIEDNVKTLEGVNTVSSQSSEGMSIVMLEYEYGRDMDQAYNDLNKQMSIIKMQLPSSVDTPTIFELDMNAMPAVTLAVSGNATGGLSNFVDETLTPDLESLSSIATITTAGDQKEYISISLDRDAINQYGLTMNDVATAIGSADFTATIGSTDVGPTTLNVSAGQEFKTRESLKSVAVSTQNGDVIQLSDIADVNMATEDADSISRYDGEDTITMSLSKAQSSTAGEVSKQINNIIDEYSTSYPDVSIAVIDDTSEQITSSLVSIAETLLLAIIISMIILFLFLGDIRASLIVASSMPVSVLVALVLMQLFGMTLNMITMCALVIGVGMMVDNSIVVLESCFRSRAEGLSLFDAAVEGTKKVIMSVFGGTLTTVVVFLPLATTGGMMGQMMKPLGFVIIFSMAASLLAAITIVPLAYYKYQPVEKEKAPLSKLMHWLSGAYRNALKYLLHKKALVFGMLALLLVVSGISASQLDMELMTSLDQGQISVSVATRPGLSLEETDKIDTQVEEIIKEESDVEHYTLTSGTSGLMGSDDSTFTVYLKDDRTRQTADIINEWKESMEALDNCDITVSNSSSTSQMATSADTVSVNLRSDNYDDIRQASTDIVNKMKTNSEVAQASSSFANGAPIVKLQFDPQMCAAYGFNASQVSTTVYNIMNGVTAAQLTENGNDYDIKVEFANEKYDSVDEISKIQVTSAYGYSVDLSDICDIVYKDSPATITREDSQYSATVDVELKPAYADDTAAIEATIKEFQLPSTVEFAESSINSRMMDEFSNILKSLLIAIFLVFAVMTIQFESARFSVMVMICIPFAVVGSFLVMYFTGSTLSMTAMLGFMMLIGTVVNSGILYVDTVNANRNDGMELDDALIEAGVVRLRPILMTTLTTICSMMPLALGIGKNTEMLQGFALIDVGGLTASTLMALLLLPTFYLTIMKKDKKDKKHRKHRRKKNQQEMIASEMSNDTNNAQSEKAVSDEIPTASADI